MLGFLGVLTRKSDSFMPQSPLLSFLARSFRPPFHGLAIWLWGFFVWCFLVHPESAILHGALIDSDDAIHLVRAIDWLQGQSWFDPVLHRLAPPEGVAIHYSRLTELPLAALLWPLHHLGASWPLAAILAAGIWPLVLLGVFFVTLRWLAEGFVPRDWARASAYPAFFVAPLMLQFSPGRVDHHGLSVVITALALGCVVRFMRDPANLKWALGGGFLLALGQTIALETLPWVLLFSGWVGLWVAIKGRGFALSAIVFGLSLYVFAFMFLALSVAPDVFYQTNFLSYSWLYVLLAGGLAAALVFIALVSLLRKPWLRFGALFVSAVAFIGFFLSVFPELAAGPYGGMNRELAEVILGNVGEAAPLLRETTSVTELLTYLPMPLLGFAACYWIIGWAKGEDIWKWLFLSLLIIAATFLVVVYQVRVIIYAALFSIVPLTVLLKEGLARAREKFHGRKLFAAELFLILLVGPLSGIILPALADGRTFNKGVVLFPVITGPDRACFPDGLIQILTLPVYYGDRPRLIMNTMNEGSTILLHTKHKALAAPYHTNVKGNLASAHFFRATDPREAEKIIRAEGAELVVMCQDLALLYRNDESTTHVRQDGSYVAGADQTFAQQLAAGQIPSWLKRVELPFLGSALLFEVKGSAKQK